jgi:hypothetical protein
MYWPHLLRRILGDMKFHQLKVMQQMYGAFLFFRENKNQLINKTAQAATAGAPGSYSRRW